MAVFKIFVSHSRQSSTLAAALRDALEAHRHDVVLWDGAARTSLGGSSEETFRNIAQQYNFCLIFLVKADMEWGPLPDGADAKASSNSLFEAGFLRALMGRERCRVLYGGDPKRVPSNLRDASMPFDEPAKLSDCEGCARAMAELAMKLEGLFASAAVTGHRASVPLLTIEDLFKREQPRSQHGDLREGLVMVCDVQPHAGDQFAVQVGTNIRNGINYLYFLHYCEDTIEQIFRSLQIILVSSVEPNARVSDLQSRRDVVKSKGPAIVEALRYICESKGLRIGLLDHEPHFSFRLHNADDREHARLYARYRDRGFLLWASGQGAAMLANITPKYVQETSDSQLFTQLKVGGPDVSHDAVLWQSMGVRIARYFPGIEEDIMHLCVGTA